MKLDHNRAPRAQSFLFVLLWDPKEIGGVNSVVRNLVDQMKDRTSLDPVIVVNDWNAVEPSCDSGAWRFRLSVLGELTGLALLVALVKMPVRLLRILLFLRSRRAGVVDFHYLSVGALGVAILKHLGLYQGRLAISLHGTDVRAAQGAAERLARRVIFAATDCVIAVSHSLAKRAAVDLGLDVSRIAVVYNGVDHAIFNPQAAELPLEIVLPDCPYIISVGRYVALKGHVTLLDAFAKISGRYPDLRLCIVGSEGPERAVLATRCAELGLATRVQLISGLDPMRLARLVSRARACIQPSLTEGLPLAVLEAAASGTPLGVSSIPAHQELVSHGISGLLFTPGDVTACASVMSQLLDDPAAAASMAEVQRSASLSSFTWEACLAGYLRELGLVTTRATATRV